MRWLTPRSSTDAPRACGHLVLPTCHHPGRLSGSTNACPSSTRSETYLRCAKPSKVQRRPMDADRLHWRPAPTMMMIARTHDARARAGGFLAGFDKNGDQMQRGDVRGVGLIQSHRFIAIT